MNFGSRAAGAGHAPLAGTAVRGDAYVFVPVPKRLWGANEMSDAWASPEELTAISEARTFGVVTRLYNPVPGAPEAVLVYAGPAGPSPALAPLLEVLSRRGPVDQEAAPRFFVCTQGTRDRCCAKWGFAVQREALRLFETGASPFRPFECSHLGGDRFAATGVFMPSGTMHGHLDTADLQAVAAAESEGVVSPATYRGRVFEAQLTQVVRAGLARDGWLRDANTPLAIAGEAADGALEVEWDGGRYAVSLEPMETRFFSSCANMDRGRTSRGRRFTYAGAQPLD